MIHGNGRDGKRANPEFPAGAFYDFKVVIVPPTLATDTLARYLQEAQAELLIAEAGALSLPAAKKGNTHLSSVIWVAKHGSRHMDWNEVPEGIGGELEVAVWHELVQDKKASVGVISQLQSQSRRRLLWFPSGLPRLIQGSSLSILQA